MPLIAITVPFEGKFRGVICGCTIEEYNNYMEYDKINSYVIPMDFVRDYFEKNNLSEKDIARVSKTEETIIYKNGKPTEYHDDLLFLWQRSSIITLIKLRELVAQFPQLYINNLLDAYAEHLKDVKF